MCYEEFKDNLLAELRDFYGNDAKVELKTVTKNNGVKLHGIQIELREDERICPVIYINQMYEDFEAGDIDMIGIIDKIIQIRGDSNKGMDLVDKIGIFTDWTTASDAVFPALIKTEDNKEMLETLVSRSFLDLSVIYVLRIDDRDGSCASVKVTKDMMKNYGISQEELDEAAMYNLRNRDKPQISTMRETLSRIMHDSVTDIDGSDQMDCMHVLTNKTGCNGAAQMLNMEQLKGRYDRKSFYIIPSSVNELILLDDTGDMDVAMVNQMIRDVNATQLSPEEVLSDHCYYYDFGNKEVRMFA